MKQPKTLEQDMIQSCMENKTIICRLEKSQMPKKCGWIPKRNGESHITKSYNFYSLPGTIG